MGSSFTSPPTNRVAVESRHANSLVLQIAMESLDGRDEVVNAVSSKFPDAALVTLQEDSLNLKWNIPTKPDDRMSTLLGTVQSLAEEIPIRDFCLSQASLEDVFVILNHKYKEEEENRI
ncbi:hypothetical protein ANCCEY_01024 [Ancylostoma ceylanicum]|uniref:ABC transporter domain-containing protein n=1 Tax=Ancylostoma ceylanicum TaxID=53326 RepID=A0A0D6M8L9_9BILA|nr:hypothetical protein ANCCEY_01024 [Ancylostoma ceylanicum]